MSLGKYSIQTNSLVNTKRKKDAPCIETEIFISFQFAALSDGSIKSCSPIPTYGLNADVLVNYRTGKQHNMV